MILTGIVLKIHEQELINDIPQRRVTIKSDIKNQTLDIFFYKNLAFRSGFLREKESVVLKIVLQGIENTDYNEIKIAVAKIVSPIFKLTKDHPLIDCEWLRIDYSYQEGSDK